MPRRAGGPPQPKPPALQFYVRDWLTSTVGMPLAAKGLHIDLLCIAWDNGALPDDPAWRQRVAGVSAREAAALWAILRPRWKQTRKGWINPRLERQRRAGAAYRAHARRAAGARWASAEHESGIHRASIEHGSGRAHPMPERSTSSSSSSADQDPDQDQRATAREANTWKINHRLLVALAHTVLDEIEQGRVPEGDAVAEIKTRAGRAKIRYGDFDEVHKALRSAEAQRARRRA